MNLLNIFKSNKLVKNEKSTVNNDAAVVLNEKTSFDVKESYKELRTNVMFSLSGDKCKKIAITSSVASEGKSTTCFNLALTFAETNSKVLVIDCDLRKPKLYKLVQMKLNEGLSNCLIGKAKIDDVIRKSGYENLDVILAGNIPPNPTELLSSQAMNDLVDELVKRYDYIFFDTPPITVVTDSALLSKLMDGFVIVVRHGVAEKQWVMDAVSKLKFVNAKIIGFVLNNIKLTEHKYGYYKRGYYKRGYYKRGYYKKAYYRRSDYKTDMEQ